MGGMSHYDEWSGLECRWHPASQTYVWVEPAHPNLHWPPAPYNNAPPVRQDHGHGAPHAPPQANMGRGGAAPVPRQPPSVPPPDSTVRKGPAPLSRSEPSSASQAPAGPAVTPATSAGRGSHAPGPKDKTKVTDGKKSAGSRCHGEAPTLKWGSAIFDASGKPDKPQAVDSGSDDG